MATMVDRTVQIKSVEVKHVPNTPQPWGVMIHGTEGEEVWVGSPLGTEEDALVMKAQFEADGSIREYVMQR